MMNTRADAHNVEAESGYQEALDHAAALLPLPENYILQTVQLRKQNTAEVWLFRYGKINGVHNGLGGEHFSFVVEKDTHTILGFTWMDQSLRSGSLPTPEETKAFAEALFNRIEPGMSGRLQNLWIDRHDEEITITDELNKQAKCIVPGMKYKCYCRESNSYAWVIVGTGGRIVAFEQGIEWRNGRVTEKWLHDSWLRRFVGGDGGDEENG